MARGGINKAVVQTARLALIARGEHPSIDAVRVEMGNTGSKTTIHRYLKELDEADSRLGAPQASIGDELTELVARLAQRLEEQAQEPIDHALAQFEARQSLLQKELATTRMELNDISERHVQQTQALEQQTSTLLATQEQLQTVRTENARLQQAGQDMNMRLQDKDGQIRSLEEKHLHARDALEHYRNAVKEQRDQEQRRHEGQVQQVQMELRQAQQSAMVRQEEITQLNRDNERLLAQTRGAVRELDEHKDQVGKLTAQMASTRTELQQTQTRCVLLEERLGTAQQDSAETRQQLIDQQQQNRVLELILIKTELALENLRAGQAPPEAAQDETPPPDQD
jgi:chromosome segregation ATPase